jgi:hypothetical protein
VQAVMRRKSGMAKWNLEKLFLNVEMILMALLE